MPFHVIPVDPVKLYRLGLEAINSAPPIFIRKKKTTENEDTLKNSCSELKLRLNVCQLSTTWCVMMFRQTHIVGVEQGLWRPTAFFSLPFFECEQNVLNKIVLSSVLSFSLVLRLRDPPPTLPPCGSATSLPGNISNAELFESPLGNMEWTNFKIRVGQNNKYICRIIRFIQRMY